MTTSDDSNDTRSNARLAQDELPCATGRASASSLLPWGSCIGDTPGHGRLSHRSAHQTVSGPDSGRPRRRQMPLHQPIYQEPALVDSKLGAPLLLELIE